MTNLLMSSILSVLAFASADMQAEKFLTYARNEMWAFTTNFDNTGNLWLVAEWDSNAYTIKINPKGEALLDKVPFLEPGNAYGISFLSRPTFNTWDNCFVAYCPKGSSMIHLIQIKPSGEYRDYYPWPNVVDYMYLGILPGDTLMILGNEPGSNRQYITLAKALTDSNTISPIFEKTDRWQRMPAHLIANNRFCSNILDVDRSWGVSARIRRQDTLIIGTIDLTLQTEIMPPEEKIGPEYLWKNYVWRSFKDAWIGQITFAPFNDGGYVLYIPDPSDPSQTFALRLDKNGVPLDPEELDQNGTFKPRSFDRLPKEAKRYVHFGWWTSAKRYIGGEYLPDSTQLLFWGSDDEGNLYTYRNFKKY